MTNQVSLYRLITLNGIAVDFQSVNSLEALWSIFKGDGFYQVPDTTGHALQRIPFHALASLQRIDPTLAKIYAPPGSETRN
jgi:hypothetical protein